MGLLRSKTNRRGGPDLPERRSGVWLRTIAAEDTKARLHSSSKGEQLDAVLSDYKLPGLTGTEPLSRPRANQAWFKGHVVTGNPGRPRSNFNLADGAQKALSYADWRASRGLLAPTEAD